MSEGRKYRVAVEYKPQSKRSKHLAIEAEQLRKLKEILLKLPGSYTYPGGIPIQSGEGARCTLWRGFYGSCEGYMLKL